MRNPSHARAVHSRTATARRSQPSLSSTSRTRKPRRERPKQTEMSAIAPDATAIFKLVSACADDDAVRTLLGTSAGKNLQVDPQHIMGGVVGRPLRAGMSGTDPLVDWLFVDFAILHVADISDLP